MVYLSLIHNLALLIALSVVHQLILRRVKRSSRRYQLASGVIFGGVAVAGMLTPLQLEPGIIFDGRSVVIVVAGMFGGPVVAAVAALISGAYRVVLGGGGTMVGVTVIAMAALLGSAYYYLRQRIASLNQLAPAWIFGLLVHLLMLAIFLWLPDGVGRNVVKQIGLPILLAYPVVTMLLFQFFRNIETEVLAEHKLKESEEKYRMLFEEVLSGFALHEVVLNSEGRPIDYVFLEVNSAFEQLTGLKREAVVGKRATEVIPGFEEDPADWIARYGEVALTGEPINFEQYSDHLGNWYDVSAFCPRQNQFATIFDDISEKKQAARDKQESEYLFAAIFKFSPYPASLTREADGVLTEVNDAWCELMGYTSLEALGHTLDELGIVDKAQRADIKHMYVTTKSLKNISVVIKTKRGDRRHILSSIEGISIGGEEYALNLIVDETDRRRLEDQLRQTQKLEAIGTLAGGIAHDFNNILFAILGNADLAAGYIAEDDPAHKHLAEIMMAGQRARELVRQILTFARRSEKQDVAVAIAPLLKEAVKMLRASLPSTIAINLKLETENSTIVADPTEIHQLIMNLATNAGQAMQDAGGELELGLSLHNVEEALHAQHPTLGTGPHIVLSVSDTGPGMPPEVLERIFEPFFTTKGGRGGTGMGLSVAHGVVLRLGGAISAYSEVGQGTTFKVWLPLTEIEASTRPAAAAQLPHGSERILVVDDEPVLATLLKGMLEGLGYTVVEFTDSEQALAVFNEAPDGYDLIITDQTMPKLTGIELATRVLAEHPGQPIIICTGFSHIVSSEAAAALGIAEYLTKPISKQVLAVSVRQVLDREPVG